MKEDFPRPTLATAPDAVIGGIMAGESTDKAHQNAEIIPDQPLLLPQDQ
jgi:hypothetical protein